MNLENVQKTWEYLAATDPMWAVLTWEGKENNRWQAEDFFQTGANDVNRILNQISQIRNFQLKSHRCLDFGCGVGRLTLSLADHFTEVYGVDISPSMVAHANRFAHRTANARFHINQEPDLKLFESDFFDCVLTLIVLQHMENSYQETYLSDFVRVLTRGGLAVFQLPDQLQRFASYAEFTPATPPEMEMHGMAPERVVALMRSLGGDVLQVLEDDACGDLCKSYRYFVTK